METSLKGKLTDALAKVIDPETGMDVVSMKLIRDLQVDEEGHVKLTFRPSSFVCPLGFSLGIEIKDALRKVDGVKSVDIRVEGFVHSDRLTEILGQLD